MGTDTNDGDVTGLRFFTGDADILVRRQVHSGWSGLGSAGAGQDAWRLG